MEDNNTKKSVVVNLCGNGCCPNADFGEEDKVILSDNGQVIVLSKPHIMSLVKELLERGYLGK
jgi:hypothetical protein